ncbi:LCP family protein [Candidatus Berkelbacteria bacterium]|nr:LCP family protein [Candidatus Berkelbacteria bacterium]
MLDESLPQHGEGLERIRRTARNRRRFLWGTFSVLIVAGIAWFGFTTASALTQISGQSDTPSPILRFAKNALDPNALAGEGDGRINVLLIGIGGSGHKGGTLADTIMVASLDPQNHKLALLSIPRDLRVPIAGGGTGKINAAHSYGETRREGTGPQVLKDTVHGLLDLPIHYIVRVDFQGFVKLVDTIGGVTIDVPTPLNDPLFPDTKLEGYDPLYIPAGRQHMSGTLALKYVRSRETTSDFARAGRQQQLLLGVKDSALSLGVLSNPKKLTDLISILGTHVRTDLSLKDMQRLVGMLAEIDPGAVITKVLDNSPDGPLRSTSDGGYYLVPKTGDFSEVKRIAHELFTDPYLLKEKARIEIQNGTGTTTAAHELELDLRSLGYTIVSSRKVDTVTTTQLLDYSGGSSPFTLRFLEERLHVQTTKASRPPDGATVDLRLILGSDYQPVESSDADTQ